MLLTQKLNKVIEYKIFLSQCEANQIIQNIVLVLQKLQIRNISDCFIRGMRGGKYFFAMYFTIQFFISTFYLLFYQEKWGQRGPSCVILTMRNVIQ